MACLHHGTRNPCGLVPPSAPRPHEIPENLQSRPSPGTETTRNRWKPIVSSLLWHRDRTDSPEISSLVPPSAPRPHGIPENLQSRPPSSTETTRNRPKPAVSSLSKHRDHSESPKTDSLVPLPAPRPHGIHGYRQSRPSSGTETTRIRPKPAVSSHFKHRDHSESPKTCSLVPLQAPRPLGIPENRQSRPSPGTETTWNPPKPAVSSHFKHRDHSDFPETDSLVPPSAPRPLGFPGNRQSRPSPGTETTRNPRKTAVSSLLQHRDHLESPEISSLVPLQAPRPRGFSRNQQSRPSFSTETTRNPPKTCSLVPPSAPRPHGFP